jgi:hypothetical protein
LQSKWNFRPVGFIENDRHSVVQFIHDRVGRRGKDRATLNLFAGLRVFPLRPESSHDHLTVIVHGYSERLFVFALLVELFPFVKAIGHNETTLTVLPGIPERGFGDKLF